MSRFPKLLTGLFREFRNSYNEGVDKIDAELDLQKKRVDDLITGTPQPSEVVDARGEFPVLRDRLDNVNSLLAQTVTVVNVKRMFGAKGDGVTDDTQAIQNAIDSLSKGGTVFFPQGRYKITKTIRVKPRVILLGTSRMPDRTANTGGAGATAYDYILDANVVFLCYGGDLIAETQILLDVYSGIEGIVFQYPEQVSKTSGSLIAYGYTIATDTTQAYNIDGIYLKNIFLYNSYKGISIDKSGQFIIENVFGDCYSNGLYVDRIKDVGRMKTVHFWTFSRGQKGDPLFEWVHNNGRAFDIRETDGLNAFDLYEWGYKEGFYFDEGVNANQYPWATLTSCVSDFTKFPIVTKKSNTIQFNGGQFISGEIDGCPITTGLDVNGSVIFNGISMFGGQSIGAIISSNTGAFLFNNIDSATEFGKSSDNVGGLFNPIIVEGDAEVHISNSNGFKNKLPFGGKNVWFDGVRLPSLDTDVSPANLNMATWTNGLPDNWTAPNGKTRFTQIVNGIAIDLSGSKTTEVLDYSIPQNRKTKGFFILEFDYEVKNPVAGWTINFRTCRANGADVTWSATVKNNKELLPYKKIKMRIPVFTGIAVSDHVLRITCQTFSTSSSGTVEITNIKMYDTSVESLSDQQLELMFRTIHNDVLNYGRRYYKQGKRQIFYYVGAPTFGEWNVGDEVVNITPTPGGYRGYTCTNAGSPGTWKGFGTIQT